MTLHLPDRRSVPRPSGDQTGTWIDLPFLDGLGVEVKDLGDGTIGLCPSPERCIPVPEHARDADTVNLGALAEALEVVVADDGHHAVVRPAPAALQAMGRAHLQVGDRLDLTLPDLDGHDRPVIPRHGRAAVFAWASW
ncbi:MAG: hypothetical protein WD638_02895 [Nitriliruptoraceae bacterium]